MPAVAHLDDEISHGGRIITASEDVYAEGRQVARVGDKARCQRHGTVTIIDGVDTVIVNGSSVAVHGSRCSCGAQVIATGSVYAGGE